MAQPTGRRKKVPSPLGKLCPTGKRPWDTDLVSVLIGTTERGTPEVMAICLSFSNNHGSMGLSLDWPASESDHLPKCSSEATQHHQGRSSRSLNPNRTPALTTEGDSP